MDVMQAAFNVAEDYRPGGAAALAVAVGKNPTTFSHEVHGTGAAKLGVLTAVKMTKRTGDLRILLAFAAECGQMCLPLPNSLAPDADDCMRAMSETSREFGELCQQVCLSLGHDGEISNNELERIQREGGELMAALQSLMGSLQVRNMRGQVQGQSAP